MAREQVAGLINANSDQIIFTSGGTAIKLKLISPPGKPPKAGSNVKPRPNQDKEKK
jgi:cysteine desulfurase